VRIGARLASAEFAPLPRTGSTSRTSDSEYLFCADGLLHDRERMLRRPLLEWSILNRSGAHLQSILIAATVCWFTVPDLLRSRRKTQNPLGGCPSAAPCKRQGLRRFFLAFHFRPPCSLSSRDSLPTGCRDRALGSRHTSPPVRLLFRPSCFLCEADLGTSSSRRVRRPICLERHTVIFSSAQLMSSRRR